MVNDIYVIEELRTDALENQVHLADYVPVGYVEMESLAKACVAHAGMDVDTPRLRYRKVSRLARADILRW